jgi:hypothetical protein
VGFPQPGQAATPHWTSASPWLPRGFISRARNGQRPLPRLVAPMSPDPVAFATPPSYAQPDSQKKVGMAVASMVLGIFTILVFWIPVVGFVGIVTGLLAIVLGAVANGNVDKRPQEFGGKGMALTGLVLGIVALALTVLFWLIVGSIIAAFA